MRFEPGGDAPRPRCGRRVERCRTTAGAGGRIPAAVLALLLPALALTLPAGPMQAGEVISEDRPPVEMTVSDAGVAGIGAHTPFDPLAVRQELPPGYTVSMASYGGGNSEDEPLRMINVLRSDIPVLSVVGGTDGRVALVQVLSPRIGFDSGTVSDRFDRFFSDAEEGDCARGEGRLSTMVVCTPTEGRQVSLFFAVPEELEPDGRNGQDGDRQDAMPAEAELRTWRLKYIIWSATASPQAGAGAAESG